MSEPKTSSSHPIRVDWLPTPWPGQVGLTFAPGKKDNSAYSGAWDRDLRTDLQRLRNKFLTDDLVSLVEDHELKRLGIADLVEVASSVGITVHRLPIQDGYLANDDAEFAQMVAGDVQRATAGRRNVIHCKGGLGRAGTTGGCVLIASGMTADAALHALREARGPDCPENDRQRQYIARFRPPDYERSQ